MNSNNYIRKIDELGRIVIPKEVRNKLKIQDNENIMITTDAGKILISKYSYLNNYLNYIKSIGDAVVEIFKIDIRICDRDKEIYNSNSQAKYLQKVEVIKSSINVGTVEISSSNNNQLLKFLARIISYGDFSS